MIDDHGSDSQSDPGNGDDQFEEDDGDKEFRMSLDRNARGAGRPGDGAAKPRSKRRGAGKSAPRSEGSNDGGNKERSP